jgi:hypothetical protein
MFGNEKDSILYMCGRFISRFGAIFVIMSFIFMGHHAGSNVCTLLLNIGERRQGDWKENKRKERGE